ncbi:hypothetical protein MTO96_004687 [Rhipicephalus appendiculatus]
MGATAGVARTDRDYAALVESPGDASYSGLVPALATSTERHRGRRLRALPLDGPFGRASIDAAARVGTLAP